MCDPMTALAVASVGASIGGSMIQSNEAAGNQARAITAKNEATARNIAAEQQLQDRSSNVFNTTLKPFQGDGPSQALQTAQAANTNTIAANAPTTAALTAGATTGNAPKVVQDDAAGSVAGRQKNIADKGAAFGDLLGYGSANQATGRALGDSALQLGTVGDFAKGRAMVGQAQMESDVANSQHPMSPWGDLLKGAGQLGGFYAGTKGAFGNILGPKVPTPAFTNGNVGYY